MERIEKINFLLDQLESKLETQNSADTTPLLLRENNLKKTFELYEILKLSTKHPDFSTIFHYTAMNLAGIGLKNENFGEIHEGKYVQIISIAYELNSDGKRITKNSSLGYYGKAEKLKDEDKSSIIEFVLRWRYEKTFQHSDEYQQLLERLY